MSLCLPLSHSPCPTNIFEKTRSDVPSLSLKKIQPVTSVIQLVCERAYGTHTHTHTHLQDNLQMMAISPHTCDGCVDPPSITHRTSRQSLAGFASTKRPIVTLYRSVHMVPAHDSQKHKLNVAYQHEQTRLYVYLAVHTISSTARGHEVQLCYEMAAQVWLCELE